MTSSYHQDIFNLIPQEILEHIAFFAATHEFAGPPHGIIPLILLNRRFHSALSFSSNPHLYSRVFANKFDLSTAARRLGAGNLHATALADELRRRCQVLHRLRSRRDSADCRRGCDDSALQHDVQLGDSLWCAYLMLLENDGKNERQLREYGRIDGWLKEFWFDHDGASHAMSCVKFDMWPESHERMSLAMWLFWLLLKPDEYMQDQECFREATGILKLVALGAHQYPLSYPPWYEHIPSRRTTKPTAVRHFGMDIPLVVPAPSAPAILSYLTLANKLTVSWEAMTYMKPLAPTVFSTVPTRSGSEWDGEWARMLSVADPKTVMSGRVSNAFRPGSIDGVWEGIFTYTEFTAYAALLSGAPPTVLQRSLVAQHRQTWKLREYHLLQDSLSEDSLDDIISSHSKVPSLTAGNPSRGYIPNGTQIHESTDELVIHDPTQPEPIVYRSCASLRKHAKWDETAREKVQDVFITGEGHSAWGQFSLIGRVRPCDGFISLSKEYVDGDRGKWLYRGYLVGDANGNLSGRWRDTLTQPQLPGYEGCFVMSRRKL